MKNEAAKENQLFAISILAQIFVRDLFLTNIYYEGEFFGTLEDVKKIPHDPFSCPGLSKKVRSSISSTHSEMAYQVRVYQFGYRVIQEN